MASNIKIFIILSFLTACFATFHPPDVSERCQNSLHRQYIKDAINTYLRKIPNRHNFLQSHPAIEFALVSVNSLEITGLGSLWLYQPPRAYCIGETTVVEVVLLTGGDLRLSLGLETCSRRKIELQTSAQSSRIVAVFSVKAPNSPEFDAETSAVRLLHVYPEDVQNIALHFSGVEEPIGHAVYILGVLITPYLESFWRYTLRNSIQLIIEE